MNNAIADCYLEQMKTRKLSERELKEAVYASIRSSNAKLLEACMGKLPNSEGYWGEDGYPTYFAIREMASSEIIRILVESGYKLPYYPDLLPFNGTPKEMISLLMRDQKISRKEAISLLIILVNYYIDVMSTGYSCHRVPFRINPDDEYEPCFFLYLDNWLSELAILLEEEECDLDGKHIGISVGAIASHPELIGAFKTLINTRFFDRSMIGWYMNDALEGDNEEAFRILLELANEGNLQDIQVYPRTSMKLLNQLLELNILTPGTDKAYKAFRHYIFRKKVGEEEEEILRAIMHPSYGSRRCESGGTLLMDAILNKDFEPWLYPVLVTSPEELNARDNKGRTALYYLAKGDYPECLGVLTSMGAIPFCIDEKGNNLLHILLGGDWQITLDDIVYDMGYLPKELITMRNAEGKTPIDILADRLYESKLSSDGELS